MNKYDKEDLKQISDFENKFVEDNNKVVKKFGEKKLVDIGTDLPEFYTFKNGLIYSHRDFDIFMQNLKKGEKSAIVSGFNPSNNIHIGHIGVFDTNLFFQKEYGLDVFVPLSDDESYVAGKVPNQEEGLKRALRLVRSLIAYGYDLNKTHVIIDQLYTNIYNLAIKLSKGITMSEIKDVYGYTNDQNTGLHFYPAIQSAHVTFPQTLGIPNVLVPIGPDEDAHLRVSRDVSVKFGYRKTAVLHSIFLPGFDGDPKMSKSKGNAVFLLDDEKTIKKAVMNAFSGGRATIDEHKEKGGIPEIDISYLYLKYMFLDSKESKVLYEDYRNGRILSGEMKKLLLDKILDRSEKFKNAYNKVTNKDIAKIIMTNEDVDVISLIDKMKIFD